MNSIKEILKKNPNQLMQNQMKYSLLLVEVRVIVWLFWDY